MASAAVEEKGQKSDFDFSSSYSENLPGILKALNISLAVTSYQSASLIFIRSDGETINTHFKAFQRPMGVFADGTRLTLGTFTQVLEFRRSDGLLRQIQSGMLDNENVFSQKVLEKDKEQMERLRKERETELAEVKKADALYLHRASLTTGMINIHDIAWGEEGLWVVNSTFSCLCTLSPDHSFVARWKPPFITALVPEDRCHLNGMAMLDGRPKYVTAFNKEDARDSWVKGRNNNGCLLDVDTGDILVDGLVMPHSPKVHQGAAYYCHSGWGSVWKFEPETNEKHEIVKLPGFTRGLCFYGGLMFVCTSQVRLSDIGDPIPLAMECDATRAGVWIVNLHDNSVVAQVTFEGDVSQIYDIAVIPESACPELLDVSSSLTRHMFDFSEEFS